MSKPEEKFTEAREELAEVISRLSEEKEALSKMLTKLVMEKTHQQRAVQQLQDENAKTQLELDHSRSLESEKQRNLEKIRQELMEIRDRYNSNVYDRVDIDRDIESLQGSLQTLSGRINDAREAQDFTEDINNTVLDVQCLLDSHLKDRLALEDLRKEIDNQLLLLRKRTYSQSLRTHGTGNQIRQQTDAMIERFQSRQGIETTLKRLGDKLDLLHQRVDAEVRSRNQLEILVEGELIELDRRLLNQDKRFKGLDERWAESFKESNACLLEIKELLRQAIACGQDSGTGETVQVAKQVEEKLTHFHTLLVQSGEAAMKQAISEHPTTGLGDKLSHANLQLAQVQETNALLEKRCAALEAGLQEERSGRESLERKVTELLMRRDERHIDDFLDAADESKLASLS